MKKLDTLTKPRFSVLHVALLWLTFIVATALFDHWSDFKAGFRDGRDCAAAR